MKTIILIDCTTPKPEYHPKIFFLPMDDYPYDDEPNLNHVLPLEVPKVVTQDEHIREFGDEMYLNGIYCICIPPVPGPVSNAISGEDNVRLPPEIGSDDECFRMYIKKYCNFHPKESVQRLHPTPIL